MADPARDLEAKALGLPSKARARLAERLISSLEEGVDAGAETAWLEEAERRLDDLESGRISPTPAEEALRKSRSSLR